MAHGGLREGAGRKKNSKDKLTQADVDHLKPAILLLLESLVEKGIKAKVTNQIRIFNAVAPYLIQTADRSGSSSLTDGQIERLRILADREMVSAS